MSEKHKLFDIWRQDGDFFQSTPWRAQMVNFTAHFKTQEQAEKYVAGVQEYRRKNLIK